MSQEDFEQMLLLTYQNTQAMLSLSDPNEVTFNDVILYLENKYIEEEQL